MTFLTCCLFVLCHLVIQHLDSRIFYNSCPCWEFAPFSNPTVKHVGMILNPLLLPNLQPLNSPSQTSTHCLFFHNFFSLCWSSIPSRSQISFMFFPFPHLSRPPRLPPPHLLTLFPASQLAFILPRLDYCKHCLSASIPESFSSLFRFIWGQKEWGRAREDGEGKERQDTSREIESEGRKKGFKKKKKDSVAVLKGFRAFCG